MRSPFPNPKNLPLRLAACMMLFALGSSGCVHRIDIQQGNSLDQKAVGQLTVGMTRSQVRYLLGTPLANTPFDHDRWDYVYYLKRGHSRKIEEQKLTVYFEGDKVARIERPDAAAKNAAAT